MKKTLKQKNSQQPSTVRNTRSLTFEERELVSSPVDSDEDELDQAKVSWLFGEWNDLVQMETAELAHHPTREKLALLKASAHQQLGSHDQARKCVRMALDWGCSPRVVAQVMIAGVHNTLGRIAALKQDEKRIDSHFSKAVDVIAQGKRTELISHARAVREMTKLGLLPQAAGLVDKELQATASKGQRPEMVKAKMHVLQTELDLLHHALSHAQLQEIPNPYVHNRTLTAELNKSLRSFFGKILRRKNLKPAYIDYLALKAIELEKRCVGRLATTVQDAVVRQVVAESVNSSELCILEIGALFGINLVILYNHCFVHFDSVKIVGVDPLSGYYGKETDAILNTPISRNTFLRNMQLGNVPSDSFDLIQYYSTDSMAIKTAKEYPVNLLIIDGDHSYEGVKFDYENYFPLLRPGGFVLFDDYNAEEWPGVSEYVNNVVRNDSSCEFLGAFSRTAVCRKIDK